MLRPVNHAQHVRAILTEFKTLGTPFALAWATALRTLPRRHPDHPDGLDPELQAWREALRWARPAWEAAYTGQRYGVAHVSGERTHLLLRAASAQDDGIPAPDENGRSASGTAGSDDLLVCRDCRRYTLEVEATQRVFNTGRCGGCNGELLPVPGNTHRADPVALDHAASL